MIPVLQSLPVDWSGTSTNNRTKGEIHDLSKQFDLPYRIVVMQKGYFYTDNLFIVDSRGYVLKENQDYQCIAVSKEVVKKVAKTACAVIMVTNPDVSSYLRIDAQMVGGQFCSVSPAILEIAANVIMGTNQKLYWNNVDNKPSDFRASGHLHSLWELFGFTEQTSILNRITTAMDKITALEFAGLFDEFLISFNNVSDSLQTTENRLTTHINNKSNAHSLTAKQVSLENVYNGPVATLAEAQYSSNVVRTSYATPLRTKQAIDANFTPLLTQHVNDVNNPHQDTAASLGTMTTTQFRTVANNKVTRGASVPRTAALDGLPFNQHYAQVRNAVPVNQIARGVFSWNYYTQQSPPANSVLQPGPNGFMVWRGLADIFNTFLPKGTRIVNAGKFNPTVITTGNWAAQSLVWLTSVLGTNFPERTIAVYSIVVDYTVATGNGTRITNVTSLTMATLINGAWKIPGTA